MIKINLKERALVNCETAEIIRPSCFDDLVPYYSYLVDRNHKLVANKLLEDVFKGEKVISKMIANSQRRNFNIDSEA